MGLNYPGNMKRIKTIIVTDNKGTTMAVYTPNFLGEHELVLLEKANIAAKKYHGKVDITYYE